MMEETDITTLWNF